MSISAWRTSQDVVARYITPKFLEGFIIDSDEYAIKLHGGAISGDVMSGSIVKRSFWDFFGKTQFIIVDGRPRPPLNILIQAVSADSLEIMANVAITYSVGQNYIQNLANLLNETKNTLRDCDLEHAIKTEGIEQDIKGLAGKHNAYELTPNVKTLNGLQMSYVRHGIKIQNCTVNWSYAQDVKTQIEIKKQELQRQLNAATTQTEIERIQQQMRIFGEQMKFYGVQIEAENKKAELTRAQVRGDPNLIRKEEELRIRREHEIARQKAEDEQDLITIKALTELQKKRGGKAGPLIIGGEINIGAKPKG